MPPKVLFSHSNLGSRAAKLTDADMRNLFEVCRLEVVAGEVAFERITNAEIAEIPEGDLLLSDDPALYGSDCPGRPRPRFDCSAGGGDDISGVSGRFKAGVGASPAID